jgi:hypothetical protein
MADGVRPRRVSTVWINARPTRPFPSVKGWIVSNWAWTMPAWTRGRVHRTVEVLDEVVHQFRDELGRRGDEVGGQRVPAGATDPVLHPPQSVVLLVR